MVSFRFLMNGHLCTEVKHFGRPLRETPAARQPQLQVVPLLVIGNDVPRSCSSYAAFFTAFSKQTLAAEISLRSFCDSAPYLPAPLERTHMGHALVGRNRNRILIFLIRRDAQQPIMARRPLFRPYAQPFVIRVE